MKKLYSRLIDYFTRYRRLKHEVELLKQLNESNMFRISIDINDLDNRIGKLQHLDHLINMGVDVSLTGRGRHNESWAVVCIDGKPSTVKFYDLSQKDLSEMVNFLKYFEHGVVDSPFDFKRFL